MLRYGIPMPDDFTEADVQWVLWRGAVLEGKGSNDFDEILAFRVEAVAELEVHHAREEAYARLGVAYAYAKPSADYLERIAMTMDFLTDSEDPNDPA